MGFIQKLMKEFVGETEWVKLLARSRLLTYNQPRDVIGRFAASPPVVAAPTAQKFHTVYQKYKQKSGSKDNRRRCSICHLHASFVCKDCPNEPAMCIIMRDGVICSEKYHKKYLLKIQVVFLEVFYFYCIIYISLLFFYCIFLMEFYCV